MGALMIHETDIARILHEQQLTILAQKSLIAKLKGILNRALIDFGDEPFVTKLLNRENNDK